MFTYSAKEEVNRAQALSDAYELQQWIREHHDAGHGRYPAATIRRIILFLEQYGTE